MLNRLPKSIVLVLLLFLLSLPLSAVEIVSVELERVMSASDVNQFISTLYDGYERPDAKSSVNVYLMMMRTMHPSGVPTDVRVQIFIPQVSERVIHGSYLFTAGSTGLVNVCRASREHEAGIRWGLYRAHVLSYAGQGFIGILPDYMGYEDWDLLQPYFYAESEARVIDDAMEAVDRWLRDGGLGDDPNLPSLPRGLSGMTRVAAGYSQGGHAVFAAADRAASQPASIRLNGVIGYGPTTDIGDLFQEYPSVGPMIVEVFSTIYGASVFDPYQVLRREWADSLEYDVTRQCVGGIQHYYPGTAEELYEPSFLASLRAGTLMQTHPLIGYILHENQTGRTAHGIPALICQGTNDIVVDKSTQDRVVEEMRAVGNPVQYVIYEGSRHDTRQIAFPDVVAWIESLGSHQ